MDLHPGCIEGMKNYVLRLWAGLQLESDGQGALYKNLALLKLHENGLANANQRIQILTIMVVIPESRAITSHTGISLLVTVLMTTTIRNILAMMLILLTTKVTIIIVQE